MKQFICDVLLTALVLAALLTAILLYKPDYDRLNNYTYKYNYMETQPESINTLLLGNSTFELCFNPHILGDSTFDLASSARYAHYDVELLRRYLPVMKNLQVCIYPHIYNLLIDPLPFQYTTLSDHYNWMHLEPPEEYRDLISRSWKFQYVNYLQRRSCDNIGYDSIKGDSGIMLVKLTQFRPDKCREYLTEMARLCAEHGVRFIVVTPPCYMSAVEGVTREGISIMHAIVDSANALYPIEYHDYLSDSTFQDEALYHNANHLNHRGATLFAEQVKADFGL